MGCSPPPLPPPLASARTGPQLHCRGLISRCHRELLLSCFHSKQQLHQLRSGPLGTRRDATRRYTQPYLLDNAPRGVMTTLLCARALQPSLATMRHMLPSVRLCAPASQRLDAFCTQKAVAARSPCSQQQRWNHQHPPYSPIPSREEVAQWYETLRLLPGASPKQFKDAYRISAQRLNTDHDRSRDWVEFAKVSESHSSIP